MVQKSLNLRDRRCVKTRLTVEKTLFDFYTTHSYFERLPVLKLCRKAKVSTPVFYRHYQGIKDVVDSKDRKVCEELTEYIAGDYPFPVMLAKVFRFTKKNSAYYRVNEHQGRDFPLREIGRILKPSIVQFIKEIRPMNRPAEADEWLCYEIESYVALELRRWSEDDNLNFKTSGIRVDEIVRYAKQRIQAMEQELSTGKWRGKKY